jgi:hypothetical protein
MRIQNRSLFAGGAAKKAAVQMGAVFLAAGLLFNVPREVMAGKT